MALSICRSWLASSALRDGEPDLRGRQLLLDLLDLARREIGLERPLILAAVVFAEPVRELRAHAEDVRRRVERGSIRFE